MVLTGGLFSSSSSEWGTPRGLFNILDAIYQFTLDACASEQNHKCSKYYSKYALDLAWDKSTFMNPPYGKDIKQWIVKAHQESLQAKTIVCLIPARTETKWFKICWDHADYICFIYGRLKFEGTESGTTVAPFPSAIAVFGDQEQRDLNQLENLGKLIKLSE